MASSYTSTIYITSARLARGYVEASLKSETATTATISWKIVCQQKSAALYGQTATCSVDGTKRGSCEGYLTSSSSSWKDVCSTSGTTTVNKTTSSRSVPVTIKTRVEVVDGYGSVTTDYYSATCSVPISAITSYTVSYNGVVDDATNVPSNQTKYYDTALKLSSATPTSALYNFLGWATSQGGEVAYQPGESYEGNAALTLYAVWELKYRVPFVTDLKIGRCNSDGSENDYGSYALITFNFSCDQNQGTNAIASATIDFSAGTASVDVSTDVSSTSSGQSGYVSKVVGGTLGTEDTYLVTVTVTDEVGGSGVAAGVIPAVMFPIDFLGNGKGVAFGMPASREGYADFGYNLAVGGQDITHRGEMATFYSTDADFTEMGGGWYTTTSLNDVKAKTARFDEVATFIDGVITFLKDGCYELSGTIFWHSVTGQVGIGIFDGDVEEYSAFVGGPTIASVSMSPSLVSVSAGDTRLFKRYANEGALLRRNGKYTWLTIKYLG